MLEPAGGPEMAWHGGLALGASWRCTAVASVSWGFVIAREDLQAAAAAPAQEGAVGHGCVPV